MIQKLFKPYIVKRKNGQCQVLIPLVELDELCEKIEENINKRKIMIKIGLDNNSDWLAGLAKELLEEIYANSRKSR